MVSLRRIVVVLAALFLLGLGPAALAGPSGGNVPNSEVKAETVSPSVNQPSAPGAVSGQKSGTLPFTGADVTLFTIIGLSAIGAGTIMVRRTSKSNS
jgi:LPXTG-motif cell wall-anchored protein